MREGGVMEIPQTKNKADVTTMPMQQSTRIPCTAKVASHNLKLFWQENTAKI